MAHTSERPQELDILMFAADLDALLQDILRLREEQATLYAADSYTASQALAAQLRSSGSGGIAYQSARRAGVECAAVFRPRLLANCRQERHMCYVWDGRAIITIYEKKAFSRPPPQNEGILL